MWTICYLHNTNRHSLRQSHHPCGPSAIYTIQTDIVSPPMWTICYLHNTNRQSHHPCGPSAIYTIQTDIVSPPMWTICYLHNTNRHSLTTHVDHLLFTQYKQTQSHHPCGPSAIYTIQTDTVSPPMWTICYLHNTNRQSHHPCGPSAIYTIQTDIVLTTHVDHLLFTQYKQT